MRRFLHWLSHSPRGSVIVTAGLMVAIGFADYATGYAYSLGTFYLLPVVTATWSHGRKIGLVTSVIGAAVWFAAGYTTGLPEIKTLVLVWNAIMVLGVLASVALLLSALRSMLQHESQAARTDALTGLHNRQHLYEELAQALGRMRSSGAPLSIVYLDLDGFKAMNDSHGHAHGDNVLRSVARSLASTVRATDFVARIGGDEFVILLPDVDNDLAAALVDRLRTAVAIGVAELAGQVTLSAGAVTISDASLSPDELMKLADEAMYRAKSSGRARGGLALITSAG